MFGLGFGELIVIFVIALIFIGPKKLPELAKGLGKGIREFQNAAKGLGDQLQDDEDTSSKKVTDASQQEQEKSPASPDENKDSSHS
jgi:sec-independent protein translocase protein TatA